MRRTVFQFAVILMAYLMRDIKSALHECTFGYYRCADNSKCISDQQLCNYETDCEDVSDERLAMCKIFHKHKLGSESQFCERPGQIYNGNYGCASISKVCSDDRLVGTYRVLCDELSGGLKPSEEMSALRDQKSSLEESFSVLASSYNKSNWTKKGYYCPPLYVKVGDRCVALFLTSKVTWVEAKHFCESISGTLAIIKKMNDYEALLHYLEINDIASNFWIGGLYKPGYESWIWLDSSPIEMGARFWSVYHLGRCKVRKNSDHCYVYDIFPRVNVEGFSLSMDYEFHYYFSDSNCLEKRSPLCFLIK